VTPRPPRGSPARFPFSTFRFSALGVDRVRRPTFRFSLFPVPSSLFRIPIFDFRIPFFLAWLVLSGCAHRAISVQPPAPQPSAPPAVERQPPVPGAYVEDGIASWYGAPFDGHRTSDGEIYDMHQFTAAHRTLPFNSIVRVTNLTNGKQTEVRINDRGPFVGNRVIDLSYAAAHAIGMVGPGTAQVRLDLVSGSNPTAGFFGVQVGAFLRQENAERLKAQLEARYSPINIVTYDSPAGLFYRVRVGRFDTESAARQLALTLHDTDRFTTFVVRLDE
jgi:rare lipoprotein A